VAWLALGSVATVRTAPCHLDIRRYLGRLACATGAAGVQLSDGDGAMGCPGHVRHVHRIWCFPWLVANLQRFRVANGLSTRRIQCERRTRLAVHGDGSTTGCYKGVHFRVVRLDTPKSCHSCNDFDRGFQAAKNKELIPIPLISIPSSVLVGHHQIQWQKKFLAFGSRRRQVHE